MPKKREKKLNKYLVTVEEYVYGKPPKVWTVYASNKTSATKIALKRIKIKKIKLGAKK